jgi:DNA-directed RNA polymerase specialized sigma24 family protein
VLVANLRQPSALGPAPGSNVLRALASLPQRKRECVVLRYYLDLSEAQTARALGISVGTVKSQTARALQQLRPLLAPDEATADRTGRGRSGSRD